MNKLFGLVIILFVGWGSVRLMTVLSADAMAMAVGVLFGVLSGIPTALLMLASNRRTDAPPSVIEANYWRLRAMQLDAQNRRLLSDWERDQ